MAQNLRQVLPWVAGVVIERLGPLTCVVQVETGDEVVKISPGSSVCLR